MAPIISVIIPVKNDERRIGNCLNAVFNQTVPPLEVILVDGHSSDQTIIEAQRYPIKLVFEEYGTVGGARQVGVEYATGDYIAFTDSDCIPEEQWLEKLLEGFGPGIIGVGGGIKNIGDGVWERSISLALNSFLGSANSVQDQMFPNRKLVRSLSGCNCCYRKSDIEQVGGFNVHYRFNEDTDLNRRIGAHGSLLYTPEAVVLHDQSRDLSGFAKRMFSFGEGRAKSRIFDLQVIPPISLIIIIPSIYFSLEVFFSLLTVYALLLIGFSLLVAIKARRLVYIISVPIVFFIEHSMYSLGFWNGIVHPMCGGKG